MKTIVKIQQLFILFLLFFVAMCLNSCKKSDQNQLNISSKEYLDITQDFSLLEFESIKNFILEKGDQQTYSVMYNNNPHFSFDGFESFLNPETGQRNINCDPKVSDFNEIVIRVKNADPQYFHLILVKQGDTQNKEIFFTVPEWMKENKVYLLNPYGKDIDLMKQNLNRYLEIIITKIKSS